MTAALGLYTSAPAFEALAAALLCGDPAVERTSLYLRAESSDFLRFNHALLRQATSVEQAYVTLAVERGLRRAESTLSLSGEPARDAQRLRDERTLLVHQLDLIPDDPWLRFPQQATYSTRDQPGQLARADQVIARVVAAAGARLKQDFVGFYAAGPVVHAFADSLGSRHWHRVETFHFDWCLYRGTDKAVKATYAGIQWHDQAFVDRLEQAAQRVPLLDRAPRSLPPGAYRAALSASAVAELLDTLGWSGFSLKSRRTGVSSLMRLHSGQAEFNPMVQLDEADAGATTPSFTAEGFLRPSQVSLVHAGARPATGGTLNSTRAAAEYGVSANGAGEQESPQALRMRAGSIPAADMLRVLDTGLYVSNLWYLNYSDRQACRVTGMTRYACFWVEHGQLVAPVQVMRFDDDLMRMFGAGLVGLSDTPEFMPRGDTYGARGLGCVTAPAAIVDGFQLTL